MCDSRSAPKIPRYSFLIDSSIPIRKSHSEPSFSLLFVFFHSETGDSSFFIQRKKYTSYTPTTPFLSFKIIHFEAYKYLFHNLPHLFVYFIDFRMCVVNPDKTLPIPCFSLWSERHVFSHGITSFSIVFYLFGVSYILKYHSSSRPFLLLLLLLLLFLAFRDERSIKI